VIFPFEPAVYEGSGARVEFVGHPLVDHLREIASGLQPAAVRHSLGIESEDRIVALLPGSRSTELDHCLPVHLEAARRIHARDPRVRFLLPVAPSLDRTAILKRIRALGLPGLLRLDVIEGRSVETLIASDVVLAKPGTSTLEASLLARPMVVAARGNALSVALLRRLVRVESLAMPNLIAGAPIVPEFLQGDADPSRIADAVLALIAGPARDRQLAALADVCAQLGDGGAARRGAAIADEMLIAPRES
jgi:lipid-A-disaccharide synthase